MGTLSEDLVKVYSPGATTYCRPRRKEVATELDTTLWNDSLERQSHRWMDAECFFDDRTQVRQVFDIRPREQSILGDIDCALLLAMAKFAEQAFHVIGVFDEVVENRPQRNGGCVRAREHVGDCYRKQSLPCHEVRVFQVRFPISNQEVGTVRSVGTGCFLIR